MVVEIENQDFRELTLVWRAFYALNQDAFLAFFHINGDGPPVEVLARIPMPNTVSKEDRLPLSNQSGETSE
ncbi:hypothetical protein [Arthrobacter sp. B0490]|uniref:hypothetical protein n=1 Tax=Arthrobacter sp. B0490 TaxID=2058891 RepID=UPI0011B0504B|nr:hypothetical protein [Arthrobacter sp. B0490]